MPKKSTAPTFAFKVKSPGVIAVMDERVLLGLLVRAHALDTPDEKKWQFVVINHTVLDRRWKANAAQRLPGAMHYAALKQWVGLNLEPCFNTAPRFKGVS